MTISAQVPFVEYTSDGSTTPLAFLFWVDVATDIKVEVAGVEVADYTVALNKPALGGTVTPDTGWTIGANVRIERVTPELRNTDFLDGGPLIADDLDNEFDRIWARLQELTNGLVRAPIVTYEEAADASHGVNTGAVIGDQIFVTSRASPPETIMRPYWFNGLAWVSAEAGYNIIPA